MNCRPGDLAIVFHAEGFGLHAAINRLLIGRIVRVMELGVPTDPNCYAALVWRFEKPVCLAYSGRKVTVFGCADNCLRPLRDPGDDALDEMLRPLPEEVTA